ncbi:transmembrane protein 94-like [Agrilus planipennis]|nr:transmembrane protein 94-like [Agrilus planipennis]
MLSYSAPSAINVEYSVVKFEEEEKESNIREIESDDPEQPLQEIKNTTSQDSVQIRTVDLNTSHEWQSLSCLTDSSDQSAPINFDMSNRAKLPRGIDKIRPHIENIDNVPLLVSLFTDCTAATTKEMVHIMQDYGEVICVFGSSANFENGGIFMKADASIAVEPLYPQVCQKVKTFKPVTEGISPVELSRKLNSISCSLSIKREDPILFPYLIMDARHFMYCFWNCVQLWLCCCATTTCLQIAAALFMLPPILTPGQVLWLCCVIIPVLSVSLIGNPTDPDVMKRPPNKRHTVFNSEVVVFTMWCYGTKFLPVIFFVLLTFTGTLASYCTDICYMRNCECMLFYLPIEGQNSTVVGGWSEHGNTVFAAQNFAVIIILLNFVAVSAGFVHREYNVWTQSPHKNCLWLVTIIFM